MDLKAALRAAALFVGLGAGVWSGVALARLASTNTTVLGSVVIQSDSIHRLGMEALIREISNSDFLRGLNRGPITVARPDVERIMPTSS